MNAPMDPMIDPATGQPYADPRRRVSQALMEQQNPLQDVTSTIQKMMQMYQMNKMFGQPGQAQPDLRPPDPVMGTGYGFRPGGG